MPTSQLVIGGKHGPTDPAPCAAAVRAPLRPPAIARAMKANMAYVGIKASEVLLGVRSRSSGLRAIQLTRDSKICPQNLLVLKKETSQCALG